jgi:hypothetical protein
MSGAYRTGGAYLRGKINKIGRGLEKPRPVSNDMREDSSEEMRCLAVFQNIGAATTTMDVVQLFSCASLSLSLFVAL